MSLVSPFRGSRLFSPDTVCVRCSIRLQRVPLLLRSISTSKAKNVSIAYDSSRTRKLPPRRSSSAFSSLLSIRLPDNEGKSNGHPAIARNTSRFSTRAAFRASSSVADHVMVASEPAHRRRRRRRKETEELSVDDPATSDSANQFLPSNSASNLSTISAQLPTSSLRRLFTTCLSLSKPRLSFLIVLTTATAYSLFPVPALLLPSTTASPSLSALTLIFLTSGTFLCSASANALNMLMEPKYDAQMSRTRNRPLVRGLIGKNGALIFATGSALLGIGGLYYGVNPTVAFLGALNIFLYAGVYTPMKRISVLNTWAGAIVGGIPPLMGWAAAAGQSATGSGEWRELLLSEDSIGGWLLAGLLYAWQFPHFNSLSWPIREEYKAAGYRMLVWTNPRMNGRVAFRYAVLCFPVCLGLWYFQITDSGFLLTSSIANAWMVREAWRFWRKEGYKGSARGLFWASVWHLPVVMVLAMVHKKGLWDGIWNRLANTGVEDDYEEDDAEKLSDDMSWEAKGPDRMTVQARKKIAFGVPQ